MGRVGQRRSSKLRHNVSNRSFAVRYCSFVSAGSMQGQLAQADVYMILCGCGELGLRTSLLLLKSQLSPVGLHAVAESHPQIGLLLRWHALPSLLNVGEGWVGYSVGGAAGGWSYDAGARRGGDGAGNWSAEHDENGMYIYPSSREIEAGLTDGLVDVVRDRYGGGVGLDRGGARG